MTEYALVLLGVSVAVLFGTYIRLGGIVAGFVDQAVRLF
jgi:hypothetical protein